MLTTDPRARRVAAARSGWSLIELLVATALGVVLMTAVAQSARMFATNVTETRNVGDTTIEEAIVTLTDDVRQAWTVARPGSSQLTLTDPYGSVTTYFLDKGCLKVRRPSGIDGSILDGVTSLDFRVNTAQRLREATPTTSYETLWNRADVGGTALAVNVEQDLPVSLGFIMSGAAPSSFNVVSGVDEQVEQATLETLSLPVLYIPTISAPPASSGDGGSGDDCGDSSCGGCGGTGGSKGGGKGGSKGGGKGGCSKGGSSGSGSSKKTTICHIPPGNPDNKRTLEVSDNAVSAHLDHGDTLGSCSGSEAGTPTPTPTPGVVIVELYEARAPDDARPYGPMLASYSFPAESLPLGSHSWVAMGSAGGGSSGGSGGSGKVAVCHIPPGNPSNAHTIYVSSSAVPAHLAHGDVLGSCEDGSSDDDTYVLSIPAPTTPIQVDVSSLNSVIEPGRSYALVIRLVGDGMLVLRGTPIAATTHTGVAGRSIPGGDFEIQSTNIPFGLLGTQTITQTQEHNEVDSVTVTIGCGSRTTSVSATVTGQVAVTNPWLGAASGDAPTFMLAGK